MRGKNDQDKINMIKDKIDKDKIFLIKDRADQICPIALKGLCKKSYISGKDLQSTGNFKL